MRRDERWFKRGVAWACARLVDYCDHPTFACDLWHEAGYTADDARKDLDIADSKPLLRALTDGEGGK